MKKLLYLLAFLSLIETFAQSYTLPTECTNPPKGYKIGGDFLVFQFNCFDGIVIPGSKIKPIEVSNLDPTTIQYNFNYKGGAITVNPTTVKDTTYKAEGVYYVLQLSQDKNKQAQISCKAVTIIKTEYPQIDVYCSPSPNSTAIKILDSPSNRKVGLFEVQWGDDKTVRIPIQNGLLPLTLTHNYENGQPKVEPSIRGVYVNSNIEICGSNPVFFRPRSAKSIVQLEDLNGGESAKLILDGKKENVDSYIQYKTKTGKWITDSTTVIKASTKLQDTLTITGLKPTEQYCFRVFSKDSCISDEVCSIKLSNTFVDESIEKITWSNLNKLTDNLSYSLKVNYVNSGFPEFSVTTKDTSVLYGNIDCRYTSSFQLTTTATQNQKKIRIISIPIQVNREKLPSPVNAIFLSLLNPTSSIRINVFEPSGYKKSKYIYYRSVNGAELEKIGESEVNLWEENNLMPDKNKYCYTFSYQNDCGVNSPISERRVCNVKLEFNYPEIKWNAIQENAAVLQPFNENYYGEIFDESQRIILDMFFKNNTSYIFEKTSKDYLDTLIKKGYSLRIRALMDMQASIGGKLVSFPINMYSNTIKLLILNNESDNSSLKIYPNPTSEFLKIDSYTDIKAGQIIDSQGKIIIEKQIENSEISVKDLPPGKYLLKLYNQNNQPISTKTVIKL